MTRIALHIDRVVLKGFDGADRHRIAFDLQTELGRLLAEPSARTQLSSIGFVPSIRTPSNNIAAALNSEPPGISAARSIAGGLLR